VTELSDENFTVHYTHSAPRDVVFECMTTPEHLAHFWGPTGTHTPASTIVVDLRPGGVFETTMVNDRSGETHTMRAVYVEVRRPAYLSWREVRSGVLTELTFIDADDGTTEVVTTQRGLPPQMRTAEARAGWLTALDRAGAYTASITRSG
jgi:uncharacterized protein YndB with AHSA1/START domain